MLGRLSLRLLWTLIGLTALAAAGYSSLASASPAEIQTAGGEASAVERGTDLQISELSDRQDAAKIAPESIEIPSIEVNADIVSVGVTDEGDFDVPDAEAAGWYQFGAAPGENGNMVIAAHVDYDGAPGAFFRLRELSEGDVVSVEADGEWVDYQVSSTTSYQQTSLPSSELFSRTGDHSLILITCGGSFDHTTRSYTDNIVVTATPITG